VSTIRWAESSAAASLLAPLITSCLLHPAARGGFSAFDLGRASRGSAGSGEDVPWRLRRVRSADPKVCEGALHELCFTIVHQGSRYSATAPAVPFLVELATAPDTHDRARLVNLLAYAAVGT
jgi:hypothetical protein